jgi:hypothetical protein
VQTNNESPLRSPVFSLQDGGGISRNYFELTHALSQLGSVSCDLALGLYRNRYPFAGGGRIRVWEQHNQFAGTAGFVRYGVSQPISDCLVRFWRL